jgi:hypothetical protein
MKTILGVPHCSCRNCSLALGPVAEVLNDNGEPECHECGSSGDIQEYNIIKKKDLANVAREAAGSEDAVEHAIGELLLEVTVKMGSCIADSDVAEMLGHSVLNRIMRVYGLPVPVCVRPASRTSEEEPPEMEF